MTKHYNRWTIILGVLCLFLLCWVGLISYFGMPSNAGTFGDQFGAVNALFSALALAGVIYTLIQQQNSMKAQQREFMNSRAYTLAYKQVDLVTKLVDDSTYAVNADFSRDIEAVGLSVYENFSDLDRNQSKLEGLRKMLKSNENSLIPFLRVLANSCELFVRLRADGMNPYDSRMLFNILRYNIDSSIWVFAQSALLSDDMIINQYIGEYLERINRFNEIYNQIKKDTDDIDGK